MKTVLVMVLVVAMIAPAWAEDPVLRTTPVQGA
jgi:hypothetical protein